LYNQGIFNKRKRNVKWKGAILAKTYYMFKIRCILIFLNNVPFLFFFKRLLVYDNNTKLVTFIFYSFYND